jgi:hypothetical protein
MCSNFEEEFKNRALGGDPSSNKHNSPSITTNNTLGVTVSWGVEIENGFSGWYTSGSATCARVNCILNSKGSP